MWGLPLTPSYELLRTRPLCSLGSRGNEVSVEINVPRLPHDVLDELEELGRIRLRVSSDHDPFVGIAAEHVRCEEGKDC